MATLKRSRKKALAHPTYGLTHILGHQGTMQTQKMLNDYLGGLESEARANAALSEHLREDGKISNGRIGPDAATTDTHKAPQIFVPTEIF